MRARPRRPVRWITIAAVCLSFWAALSPALQAQAVRGDAASGGFPATTPPGPNSAEARLDAMGPTDTCAEMRPITAVGTNIGVRPGPSERPEDVGPVCHPALAEPTYAMTARAWMPLCYCWEAPALCYGPLYFEETNLERYGYSQKYLRGVQPLVSSAQFFGTVPMLPYLLIAEPPRECVYTLGQYRPGSCVPFQWNYPYFSPCEAWRGACK